jgi:uncharacterized membrane protein YphA (DoxX/SURF4 family)
MDILLAHETWFTERRPPFDWQFLTEPASIAALALTGFVSLVWILVARRAPRPELPFLAPLGFLTPWIPRLLAIHAGASLLSQAASGSYLAPALDLPHGFGGTALAALEAILGVWLVAGYRIRSAAALLVAAGPIGAIGYGLLPVLERVDLLGIALFLVILPPDDARPGGTVDPSHPRLPAALLGLRVLVGAALVVLAFTEKLIRPDLALAFLDDFPAFNIFHAIGIDIGDLAFVSLAGAVELLFGILVISGRLPQVAVIVAGIPFNATLFFLGSSELIGHLPIYGAMLALLVYGSDSRTADVVPWFPRRRRTAEAIGRLRAGRSAMAGSSRRVPEDGT